MLANKSGFTLIELLIALSVFAILAGITSSTLFYVFNTRTRLMIQADKMDELQMAFILLEKTISQAAVRPIYSENMQRFAPLIGNFNYVEFTHAGINQITSGEKNSSLRRVAFVCVNHNLI